MRILIIVDKQGTAIDRLAQSVRKHLPHHQIIIAPIHPKRNDVETIAEAQKLMMWADIIDIHYWKSGQVLRTTFPTEFNAKPKILFHFNPYDAESEENKYYDLVVVGNNEIHERVPSAHLIPYCIDLSFFKYNPDYTEEKRVMMSVNRIEGKKGVLEVAKACRELGYIFTLVGRVSKADYMMEVMKEGGDSIEFWENATDEILRDQYYKSAIHVCNSVDNYESGTLPILEAMACGTPVLTRNIGHVPDLYSGSNMVVRNGAQNDIEDLKKELQALMESRSLRVAMREKAWDTVKNRDDRRMALDVQKLYYKLYQPNAKLVSVIIPTKDRPEAFAECLLGAVEQDYPKMEIVVADSGLVEVRKIINEIKKHTEVPIKYIPFDSKGEYTLAEARNRAVIEADGEVLVFCDDRLKMKSTAVSAFMSFYRPKSWLWGTKDGVQKGFVENFSCVGRADLIKAGMFLERMQWYGGMSQEIRERFESKNAMDFMILQEAEANSIKRATSKTHRREDIIDAKFLVYKLYHK
jgi:glycosyltransferase involved in cell wall biosynthesis